jgi:hypothetical protein
MGWVQRKYRGKTVCGMASSSGMGMAHLFKRHVDALAVSGDG